MADTEVPKAVPDVSGITGSASVPTNAKKSSSFNSKSSATSKTPASALQSKPALTKVAAVKPGSPKSSIKPNSTNPSTNTTKSTVKPVSDSKQSSNLSEGKKPESRSSSSISLSGRGSNSESKPATVSASKVGSKVTANSDIPKSDDIKKGSKITGHEKVSSSADIKAPNALDIKLNSKADSTMITNTNKDTKPISKVLESKKNPTSGNKNKAESNVQDSKKISKSEDNITSTVSDDVPIEHSNSENVVTKSSLPVTLDKILDNRLKKGSDSKVVSDGESERVSVEKKGTAVCSNINVKVENKVSINKATDNNSTKMIPKAVEDKIIVDKKRLPVDADRDLSSECKESLTANKTSSINIKVENKVSPNKGTDNILTKVKPKAVESNVAIDEKHLPVSTGKSLNSECKESLAADKTSSINLKVENKVLNNKGGDNSSAKVMPKAVESNVAVDEKHLPFAVDRNSECKEPLAANKTVESSSAVLISSEKSSNIHNSASNSLGTTVSINLASVITSNASNNACNVSTHSDTVKKSLDSTILKAHTNVPFDNDKVIGTSAGNKKLSDDAPLEEKISSISEISYTVKENTISPSKSISDVPALISDVETTTKTVSKNELITDSNPALTNTSLVSPEGSETPAAEAPVKTQQQSPAAQPPEVTKQSIRLKVWDLLEKNNYVLFPRPCKGRIPHFVGSPEAADKLATLDIFKNAQSIKVNPDKPQAHVRFLTLESGKNLLVPIPRLKSGLFKRVVPPADASKEELKAIVTQQGISNGGKSVGLEDKVTVDLVVMGAVAVSKEGYRIGKGEGYADLEFAIMMSMGAVTQDTIVVTTVHDEQVFDTLPNHLFKEHDVPVDWIVTPTRIIEVKPRLTKPSGIFWNILSNRRLNLIPIVKTLREQQMTDGEECELKEEDSDPEDQAVRPHFRRFFRYQRGQRRDNQVRNKGPRQPRESSAPAAATNNSHPPPQKTRQSRTFRRKPISARSSSAREKVPRNNETGNAVGRVRAGGDGDRPRRRYFRRPKALIAFSLRVSGITQGTRVRDLKAALIERGVRPFDITWESNKGLALLHFAKDPENKKPQFISEMAPINVVEGYPAKLEVKVPGHPKQYKYEWSVNGKSMEINTGRVKLQTRADGTVRLLIDKVQSEDSGEYTVTVKNTHGEITSKAPVVVASKTRTDIPDEAPKFVNQMEEIFVEERTCLTLTAPITGNPIPEVEWSKDGVVLSPNDRMQFTCDGSKVGLELNSCRVYDGGVYKCKLSNNLGHVESSAKVTVNRSKSNQRFPELHPIEPTPECLSAINDIILSLQDLKVKGEGEEDPKESLSVEPANPISRIESTGISAV